MPNRAEFDLSLDQPDLSPALSGIFTYGVDAIDFKESEVRRFNDLAHSLNEAAPALTAEQLAAVARRVLRKADAHLRTPFITSRLRQLAQIRTMATDPAWQCEASAARRARDLLAYVDAPGGLFRDDTPVIGHLDDALLVDAALGTLRNELEEHAEFCRYRRMMAVGLGVDMETLPLDRATWERERGDTQRLQQQLRHVHESSYASTQAERSFHIS